MNYYLVYNTYLCAEVLACDKIDAKKKFKKYYNIKSWIDDLFVMEITPSYTTMLGLQIDFIL